MLKYPFIPMSVMRKMISNRISKAYFRTMLRCYSVQKEKDVDNTDFRRVFKTDVKRNTNWFPGHMNRGLKDMQRKLRNVDCIVEIHDARIPFHGRNPNFYSFLTAIKPHILVLNKVDLSEHSLRKDDIKALEQQIRNSHHYNSRIHAVLLTNAKKQNDAATNLLIPTIIEAIKNSDRFHRQDLLEYLVMIIGVPNVGKSSIINSLRNKNMKKGKATQVGPLAGVTRSVLERIKICVDPTIYIHDTPGVLAPNLQNLDTALRLAVCGTFQDNLVGEVLIADYLLFWLNKKQCFQYVNFLGLEKPCDDINEVLMKSAIAMNKMMQYRAVDGTRRIMTVPDFLKVAQMFIRAFRNGEIGKINFD